MEINIPISWMVGCLQIEMIVYWTHPHPVLPALSVRAIILSKPRIHEAPHVPSNVYVEQSLIVACAASLAICAAALAGPPIVPSGKQLIGILILLRG